MKILIYYRIQLTIFKLNLPCCSEDTLAFLDTLQVKPNYCYVDNYNVQIVNSVQLQQRVSTPEIDFFISLTPSSS